MRSFLVVFFLLSSIGIGLFGQKTQAQIIEIKFLHYEGTRSLELKKGSKFASFLKNEMATCEKSGNMMAEVYDFKNSDNTLGIAVLVGRDNYFLELPSLPDLTSYDIANVMSKIINIFNQEFIVLDYGPDLKKYFGLEAPEEWEAATKPDDRLFNPLFTKVRPSHLLEKNKKIEDRGKVEEKYNRW